MHTAKRIATCSSSAHTCTSCALSDIDTGKHDSRTGQSHSAITCLFSATQKSCSLDALHPLPWLGLMIGRSWYELSGFLEMLHLPGTPAPESGWWRLIYGVRWSMETACQLWRYLSVVFILSTRQSPVLWSGIERLGREEVRRAGTSAVGGHSGANWFVCGTVKWFPSGRGLKRAVDGSKRDYEDTPSYKGVGKYSRIWLWRR